MPRVVVNGAAPSTRNDLAITVNDRSPTFQLRPVGWRTEDVYEMAPRTFDLLLIAAAVFTADSVVSRGGDARSELGARWRRDFRFVVPVTDPGFWSAQIEVLTETLTFLTGDQFQFAFVHRPLRGRSLDGRLFPPAFADEVILFSGGLDSLTGAFETLVSTDSRVLLVTHRSATTTATVQSKLIGELRRRFKNRITWVPVRGRFVKTVSNEDTQRSRSFLYAALGYAAASLVGLSKVRFFENGVVSLNLPISRQVVGTMATRTTHPLFLHRMANLLTEVAGRPTTIENPFTWLTKTDVVVRLRNLDGADLIPMTTSCSNVRNRTKQHPHCGCCSQCLDRRFATLASEVALQDPADRYEVDLFLGARHGERERTMAHDWTRHASRRLARMPFHQFTEAFGAELSDLAAGYPDLSVSDAYSRAFQLHRRHGETVRDVVARAIADHGMLAVDGGIPAHSLMSALLHSADQSDPEEDAPRVVVADSGAGPLPDTTASIFPLRLAFDPAAGPWLRIVGLGEFSGAHLKLVDGLRPTHAEDVANGSAPDSHRFVQPGKFGAKGTARQHAKRCRDEFAEAYQVVEGTSPEDPLLIQNKPTRGYRLDPEARFDGEAGKTGGSR